MCFMLNFKDCRLNRYLKFKVKCTRSCIDHGNESADVVEGVEVQRIVQTAKSIFFPTVEWREDKAQTLCLHLETT